MKKRFITLACVLTMVMQLFVCGTVASAAAITKEDSTAFLQWDGNIIGYYNNEYYDGVIGKKYSYGSYSDCTWFKGYNLYPTKNSNSYLTLHSDGKGQGYIAGCEGDPERGNYYEYTYPAISSNADVVVRTEQNKVVSAGFYIKIPTESVANDRIVQFTLKNTSGQTSAFNVKYDGATHKLSVNQVSGGYVTHSTNKVWGTSEYDVVPDKWLKVELRLKNAEDNKLGVGVYYDDTQVAYYKSGDARFSETLKISQIDITGPNNKTSPGLTYLDDFTVALADAKYAPSETEPTLVTDDIELSASVSGGVVTATATMTGNEIKDGVLIVALYNSDHSMIDVETSDVYTVSVDGKTRTMTCSLGGAVSGQNYKVFLFDSMKTITPLTEMLPGTIN